MKLHFTHHPCRFTTIFVFQVNRYKLYFGQYHWGIFNIHDDTHTLTLSNKSERKRETETSNMGQVFPSSLLHVPIEINWYFHLGITRLDDHNLQNWISWKNSAIFEHNMRAEKFSLLNVVKWHVVVLFGVIEH